MDLSTHRHLKYKKFCSLLCLVVAHPQTTNGDNCETYKGTQLVPHSWKLSGTSWVINTWLSLAWDWCLLMVFATSPCTYLPMYTHTRARARASVRTYTLHYSYGLFITRKLCLFSNNNKMWNLWWSCFRHTLWMLWQYKMIFPCKCWYCYLQSSNSQKLLQYHLLLKITIVNLQLKIGFIRPFSCNI